MVTFLCERLHEGNQPPGRFDRRNLQPVHSRVGKHRHKAAVREHPHQAANDVGNVSLEHPLVGIDVSIHEPLQNVLVQDQARTLNVTDEQFGTALAGDAIENATKAFLDELVDFFPGAKRLFLQKAVGLARKFGGEWNETLEKALEDPELEKRVRESMNSSTSSPGSSE